MRAGRAAGVIAALALVLAAAPPGAVASDHLIVADPVQEFTIEDPRVAESSGLATSWTLPGIVWTVNDSGDKPRVYGVDASGRTQATLTLQDAPARDTEAVAVGPKAGGGSWLWVGDIGDNQSSWPSVRVYRAPEPTEPGERDVPWTQYDLEFPDGPRDAETLLVDPVSGRLYVVSKRVQGAAVYAAPEQLSADRVNVLTKVVSAPPLVTDGAFARDGRLVIRDYLRAYVSAGIGEDSEPLALPLQPQGESITWTADGVAVLAGSEGEGSVVWRVPVPASAVEPSPSTSDSPEPSASSPPESADVPGPAAAGDASEGSLGWVVGVLVAGLAVGGGLALAARRSNRPRPHS